MVLLLKVGFDGLGSLLQPGRFCDSIKWVVLLHLLVTIQFSPSLCIFFLMVQYNFLFFLIFKLKSAKNALCCNKGYDLKIPLLKKKALLYTVNYTIASGVFLVCLYGLLPMQIFFVTDQFIRKMQLKLLLCLRKLRQFWSTECRIIITEQNKVFSRNLLKLSVM